MEGRQLAQQSVPSNDPSGKNITSLTILKVSHLSQQDNGDTTQEVVVASVTQDQPRITRVSNGVKVEGVLGGGRASLTVEMVKSADCMADFTCRVVSVDANGEEQVTTSRVQQRNRRSQPDSQSSATSATLQILDLVHQLKSEMEMTTKSTEEIRRKVQSLEGNLNRGIEEKTEVLGQKMHGLEYKLDVLKSEIQDQIHEDVEGKLDQMNINMITLTKSAENCSVDVKRSLNEDLTALGLTLKRDQDEAFTKLDSFTKNILDIQTNATDSLASTARGLANNRLAFQSQLLHSLEKVVDGISDMGVNMSQSLDENFEHFEKELVVSFKDFSTKFNERAKDTPVSDKDSSCSSGLAGSTSTQDPQSLKHCYKGMTPRPPTGSYPYPVIQPGGAGRFNFPYLCDTQTDGGGWIIIQRRTNGDVDFYRNWDEYKTGFGDLHTDFWLGNENIHQITSSGSYELRVEMKYKGKSAYARYGHFSIAGERENYALSVGDYSGTAGDSLIVYHKGQQFTTRDRDNDGSFQLNCAEHVKGAWWYKACGKSNLNGQWQGPVRKGPFWYKFTKYNPVSYSEMKIRR